MWACVTTSVYEHQQGSLEGEKNGGEQSSIQLPVAVGRNLEFQDPGFISQFLSINQKIRTVDP